MKTSYCCNVFKFEDLQRGLGYIAGLGYDGTEFWEKHLSLLKVDELAAQLKQIKLQVAQVCPYFNFTGTPEQWAASIKIAETYINYSRLLGKPLIRVFTGEVGSAAATPEQYQAGVRGLRTVCEMAAPEGIGFALETHQGSLMDSLEATRRLLDDVGMDNLGVNYQPGPGMGDWRAWVEQLGHRIVHLHCHNYGPDGKMAFLDRGVWYNFAEFVDALAKKGYRGYLSVEHGYHSGDVWETARHEVGHLKRLAAQYA